MGSALSLRLRGVGQHITSSTQHHHTSLGKRRSAISTISVDPRPIGFCGEGALHSILLPHFVSNPPWCYRPRKSLVDLDGFCYISALQPPRVHLLVRTVHPVLPAAIRTVPQSPLPEPTITGYPSSWYSFVSTSGDQPSGSPALMLSVSPQSHTLRTPWETINGIYWRLSQLAPQGSQPVSSV